MDTQTNQEIDISYTRAEASSKMEEIINLLEENNNEEWPHDEVNELTQLLIHLKQLTKSLPSNSEYKTK
jgi:hypothetical protein